MFESFGIPDWIVWYFIAQYVGMGIFGGYEIYRKRFKIGYRATFLRHIGGSSESVEGSYRLVEEVAGKPDSTVIQRFGVAGGEWTVIGSKEFKGRDELVSFHKKSFKVDLSCIGFRAFGFSELFFDYESGDLLTFGGEKSSLSPADADIFLGGGIVQRILASLKTMGAFNLIVIAILIGVAGLCFALGLFTSPYILPKENVTATAKVVLGL
jgi:hypothetical protein